MGEFPNKETQFKPDDPRINRTGLNKGVEHSKTRLLKFLSLYIKAKNELLGTEEEIEMSVLEKMDMKQIVKAIDGDTKAYKEVMDRLEGRSVETVNQKVEFDTKKEINIAIDGKDVDLSKWISTLIRFTTGCSKNILSEI